MALLSQWFVFGMVHSSHRPPHRIDSLLPIPEHKFLSFIYSPSVNYAQAYIHSQLRETCPVVGCLVGIITVLGRSAWRIESTRSETYQNKLYRHPRKKKNLYDVNEHVCLLRE